MKTDRRHELQTNVLADWLGKHLIKVQGHSKTILAVILLAIAAVIGGTFLVKDQAARSQASWNQFFQALGEGDPEKLGAVASSQGNQGTAAAVWAQLAEADIKLEEGIRDLYTNRTNAKTNLGEAERNYLAVAQATTDRLLQQRAWFGLGQVYESMAEVDKAKEFYGKLVSSAPTSALGEESKLRSEALSNESTEKWYNWFANQTPRPPAIPGMTDDFGLPNLPGDLGGLSDRPDLSVPQFPTTGPEMAPTVSDESEPGPELTGPDTESAATPPENAEAKPKDAAANPEPEESSEENEAPAEPAANESKPKSSETPAKESAEPPDAAPE